MNYRDIAEEYLDVQPDLLMGGGRKWFQSTSSGSTPSYVHVDAGQSVSQVQEHQGDLVNGLPEPIQGFQPIPGFDDLVADLAQYRGCGCQRDAILKSPPL